MDIKKSESIISFCSEHIGATTTIMVGVHGNELAGVCAIQELLKKPLEVIAGNVFIIFANLEALKTGTRFSQINMNRCFIAGSNGTSYEELRVKEILPYLEKSDFLLDIHNTLDMINSQPFLICEHQQIAKYFDVPYVIS